MAVTDKEFTCPVCGYAGLSEPAWDQGVPSYEICDCCGTEFGYEDAAADGDVPYMHERLRENWARAGYPWTSAAGDPPAGWNPAEQMRSAGIEPPAL
jgi:hypothetical protein